MPHAHETIDVWAVEGRFQHLVYSPRGGIEGLLIDTDGVSTQFVVDPLDASLADQLIALRQGQSLVVEGTESGPSPKGEAAHTVYRFERLAAIDGQEPSAPEPVASTGGRVVRFNYAKHGAANGVVLDNGDFIHTRPEGFVELGAKVGDEVRAQGPARRLAAGSGRVIDAHEVVVVPAG